MKDMAQFLRFILGGGWWTIWYGFFYLIVIFGNFVWFGEIYEWVKKGETGPGGGAIFMGLLSLGGIPVLLFSTLHLFLAFWRAADSKASLFVFGLVLIAALLFWMIAATARIAEAAYSGFITYYCCLMVFIFINLALLWVTRHESSLRTIIPFVSW
jgi:hypothetical protein